ncbi:MAG: hypothetical protein AAB289_01265 [Chloroflexota bacterium]
MTVGLVIWLLLGHLKPAMRASLVMGLKPHSAYSVATESSNEVLFEGGNRLQY